MGLWEASRRVLGDVARQLGSELVYASEAVTDEASARARAAEARNADLDLLLIQHVTFATGDVVTPLLDVPIPLGLWALPEATTTGPLPQNALCGLNLSLSLHHARSAPLAWLYGAPDDPALRRRIDRLLRVSRGWRALTRGAAPLDRRVGPGILPLRPGAGPLRARRSGPTRSGV